MHLTAVFEVSGLGLVKSSHVGLIFSEESGHCPPGPDIKNTTSTHKQLILYLISKDSLRHCSSVTSMLPHRPAVNKVPILKIIAPILCHLAPIKV